MLEHLRCGETRAEARLRHCAPFFADSHRHHPETIVCVVEPLRRIDMGHETSPEG